MRERLVCGKYSGTDGGASYVLSLAGGAFKIDIENLADADYGVSDIKPNSGYIRLYKAASGDTTEAPVWEGNPRMSWPLDVGASSLNLSLSSAEAAALGSGRFKLVVYFQTLGGMTISKEYTEIYQHTLPLPACGAAGTESSYTVLGDTHAYTNYPGYRKGKNETQNYDVPPLYLTGASGHDTKLYFTAYNAQTGPLFNGAGSFMLKVWNETANESESSAQWTAMGGGVGAGGDCYQGSVCAHDLVLRAVLVAKRRIKEHARFDARVGNGAAVGHGIAQKHRAVLLAAGVGKLDSLAKGDRVCDPGTGNTALVLYDLHACIAAEKIMIELRCE